jgi:hypothetical protein
MREEPKVIESPSKEILSRYKHRLDEVFGPQDNTVIEVTNAKDIEGLKKAQQYLVNKEKY